MTRTEANAAQFAVNLGQVLAEAQAAQAAATNEATEVLDRTVRHRRAIRSIPRWPYTERRVGL